MSHLAARVVDGQEGLQSCNGELLGDPPDLVPVGVAIAQEDVVLELHAHRRPLYSSQTSLLPTDEDYE
jgi:hypothetical protein